jgi:hypothetical protein
VKNRIIELTELKSYHNNSSTLAYTGIMESIICYLHFISFYLLHNSKKCPCTFDKSNTLICNEWRDYEDNTSKSPINYLDFIYWEALFQPLLSHSTSKTYIICLVSLTNPNLIYLFIYLSVYLSIYHPLIYHLWTFQLNFNLFWVTQLQRPTLVFIINM